LTHVEPLATALVPMKAHSERVPNKNVRDFAGRPLYHWIMDALRSAECIAEIVVNTDSERIADEAARDFGATVLWRPDHLLGDMVGIQPLIEWDLQHTDAALYLQTHSTNPLLRPQTIDQAVRTFAAHEMHDSLFTVTELYTRLYWADGRPVNHDPDHMLRTQDLEPILEENSCVYVFPRTTFEQRGHRLGARPLMLPMDPLDAVDIDEPHDFEIAEAIMRLRLGEGT
jgi:N-acylneuraminate cytidylyltransferase